jgi:hypothetical protein
MGRSDERFLAPIIPVFQYSIIPIYQFISILLRQGNSKEVIMDNASVRDMNFIVPTAMLLKS